MVLAVKLWNFLVKSNFLKPRLLTPVQASFFVLLLLILGQQGLNFWLGFFIHETGNRLSHTLLVEREGENLLNQDDNKNQNSFRKSFNHLYALVRDNSSSPVQLRRINEIKNLYDRWQNLLLNKRFFNSTSKYTQKEKDLFNSLQFQIRILLLSEKKLLEKRQHQLQQLYHISTTVNILCTLIILAGGAFNLRFLYQRVELPVRHLIEISSFWQTGQLQTQLSYSSADEIGHLASVLNRMASKFEHEYKSLKAQNQQFQDLIAAVSHDLRTPLLATRNTLDSMAKGVFGPLTESCKKICEEYRQANEELLKLVETLLSVSRYEAGYENHLDCEPLNWEKIVVKTIAQIKATAKHNVMIGYEISQSLPTVYGDELEIRRVLQNLLDNAVRVSGPDKEIFLEVKSLGETQVKVCVRDRGFGIAPEEEKQLFHRFVQGRDRPGKSGLGLYLCSQIIKAHKGTIGVESSPGEGSTFWFTIPVPTDWNRCQNK